MKRSDKKLGMDRAISRRNLIHGLGAVGAGLVLPGSLIGCSDDTVESAASSVAPEAQYYPPALTGMRGNHDGSFDAAHALGSEGQTDFGAVQSVDEPYDLVIVGGGISGLSAAHFYRKENRQARILILDNHDDFGGHAKRNEFKVGDRTLIAYGGSQTMAAPSSYSDIVKGLLDDLGVDISRFYKAFDRNVYRQYGLVAGTHFTEEEWGVKRTIPRVFGGWSAMDSGSPNTLEEDVALIPISETARAELLRLLTFKEDQIPHIPRDEKLKYLSTISYRDFVTGHLGITEPEVLDMLQYFTEDFGLGIEDITATRALTYALMPGWDAAGLPHSDEKGEPYIHHFPDGNASVARLLVRQLIPDVAPGDSMEDVVTARFDYSKLDQEGSPVRLRLNATVIKARHDGDLQSAAHVHVSYVRGGETFRVRARHCVLACYNSIIPHLCPELPAGQREALAMQVKQPMLYTSVALRNWQAFKNLGIREAYVPGGFHDRIMLDYPVSLGDYTFSQSAGEPIVAMMFREQGWAMGQGLSPQEQFRVARYELLSMPFEDIERSIRAQLQDLLGDGGFDAARDIAGITVNRWAHGYAYWPTPLSDEFYTDVDFDGTNVADDDERWPHVRARKPFGRIAIANSDAAANAMMQAAVEQAHRAVTELLRA